MLRLLASLFFSILFGGSLFAQYCTQDNRFTEVEYFSDNQISSDLDVVYGSAQDYYGFVQDLKFDIYYPADSVETLIERPFILLIHGGSFLMGQKSDWENDCKEFAKRGFVAATMSYRLGYGYSSQTEQIQAVYRAHQDANAAMRHIVNEAATYKIDTSWLFIGGGSAGAYTALNSAYVSQSEWNGFFPGISNLLGDLDTSGNNLTNTYSYKGIYNNWGAVLISAMQTNEMIPTISYHGMQDGVVSIGYSQNGYVGGSAIINDVLLQNNICSELNVDSLGGHGIFGAGTTQGDKLRTERAVCFYKSVFCSNCSSQYITEPLQANCATPNLIHLNHLDRIKVYPNPFQDKLNIEGLPSNYELVLYNAIGSKIQQTKNINNIDLPHLEIGVYLLQVKSGNGIYTIKLVKE